MYVSNEPVKKYQNLLSYSKNPMQVFFYPQNACQGT